MLSECMDFTIVHFVIPLYNCLGLNTGADVFVLSLFLLSPRLSYTKNKQNKYEKEEVVEKSRQGRGKKDRMRFII